MQNKELLNRMSENSEEHNIRCLIEEMAELTQALCKRLRGKDNLDNIAEEMSDVVMMLQVTQKCIKVPPELISKWSKIKEDHLTDWYFTRHRGEQYEDKLDDKSR